MVLASAREVHEADDTIAAIMNNRPPINGEAMNIFYFEVVNVSFSGGIYSNS